MSFIFSCVQISGCVSCQSLLKIPLFFLFLYEGLSQTDILECKDFPKIFMISEVNSTHTDSAMFDVVVPCLSTHTQYQLNES